MSVRKSILSFFLALTLVMGFFPSCYAIADDQVPTDETQGEEPAVVVEQPDPAGGVTDEPSVPEDVPVDVENPVAEEPAVPVDAGIDVPDNAVDGAEVDAGSTDAEVIFEYENGTEEAEETEEGEEEAEDEDEEDVMLEKQADDKASVSYSAHVQGIGWQKEVKDGKMAGTSGQSRRVEALKIKVDSEVKGGIEYSAHVQGIGWQGFVSNGAVAGTSGQSKRVEALKIRLTGDLAKKFDVYYRVHVQSYGWLDWASNGAPAGSEGMSKRVEAVEIVLVKKGGKAPGATANPFKQFMVSYNAHVQRVGWQSFVHDGQTAGTSGRSLRVEALQIKLGSGISGGISYCAHVQGIGWQDFVSNGAMAGTSGQSKRVEALKIKLTGAAASNYDVYYRVHAQTFGWLDWACNGAAAGTEGLSKRVEAVQIVLVPKGGAAPGSTAKSFVKPTVNYKVYARGSGWSASVKDGATAGVTGQSIALEGLQVNVADLGTDGTVQYSAHMQSIGWTSQVSAGQTAGKVNSSLRMEAVKIALTGSAANNFDIYYRVHSQTYGWLGWAKNGAPAGTEGYSKRIEAIEIQLVRKGGSAPGSTNRPYVSKSAETATDGSTLKMTLDQMASWQVGYSNGASQSTVKSLLNPASYSKGTAKYYQFANLDGYSGLSAAQIDAFLSSTSTGRSGVLKGHGLDFVAASKKYGVNECYLVAHAIVESGWGTSDLARGFSYNGKTYYNFYGIGAYDGNALSGGRGAAVKYDWSSPSKAIMGAAEFIASDYVYGSPYKQNTLYGMKWDYLRSSDTMARGWHQYASDPYWPSTIAGIMNECYSYNGYKPSLSYTAPKYKS